MRLFSLFSLSLSLTLLPPSASQKPCVEQSWCKNAPSTRPLEDGSENPGCKRWVEECPCTCAKSIEIVAEEKRQQERKRAEMDAFEATWTHLQGGGKKCVRKT